MTEPEAARFIMIATMAGALTILTGAMYAGLFAWGKLRGQPMLLFFAYLSYAALAGCVLILAWVLDLSGPWISVVVALLIGYLLAPHGIWHLCVGTHADEHHDHQTPQGVGRGATAWRWRLRTDGVPDELGND